MPLAKAYSKAVEELVTAMIDVTATGKGKRKLTDIFMYLPDRQTLPEYYRAVRRPRCIQGVRDNLEKGYYSSAQAAYDDLVLIFDNALFFNQEHSQIAQDARVLKMFLNEKWLASDVLPKPKQFLDPPPEPKSSPNGKAVAPTSSDAGPPTAPIEEPVVELDPDAGADMPGTPVPTYDDFPAEEHEVEDVVDHLEAGLPRSTGFQAAGCSYRPTDALDAVDEASTDRNLSFTESISLSIIESRTRAKQYGSSEQFDADMARLFEKARYLHSRDPGPYGRVIVCQRIYQEMIATASTTIPTAGSASNFASIPAGPMLAQATTTPDDPELGSTSIRIASSDREFHDHIEYRGMLLKPGNWVHLINPSDASKPIVAQIWKTFTKSRHRNDEEFITVCWYYRPEQTYHPPHRQFWEHEVFKTAHFVEHSVRDVIEKVCVLFTGQYVNGRPRGPHWYPGVPLYVCSSHARIVKVNNWRACVPPEVRDAPTPIYPFERPVYPPLLVSPFQRAIRGPGAIVDPVTLAALDAHKEEPVEEVGTIARRRSRRVPGGTPAASKSAAILEEPSYAGPTYGTRFPRASTEAAPATAPKRETVIGAAGGESNLKGHAIMETLPPETTRLFDRDQRTGQILWFSGPPVNVARPRPAQHTLAYLDFLATKAKRTAPDSDSEDGQARKRLEPASKRVAAAFDFAEFGDARPVRY
ncbi:hypothetical protein BKA62DRAFT_742637 [Auriculariales sp. MPI-PUGE-AT-0066]|nr:hypothetical protein BKA62DRAFT_742637 [Auriculariales sp. MPI-PUGE-AT-0066]